ncbi:MAG: SLBB domain-containing protein [Simkaniaceae bacterium]|nr:SLBB domain-containing protein [Simkaniaceae bacterium]
MAFAYLGCTNPPYRGDDILGAEEFVLDSYKIREGKFSILELEGKPYEPLSPELLDEYEDTVIDGDVLSIVLFHPTRHDLMQAIASIGHSVGFNVTEGHIVLPDLGLVNIGGLTLEQARLKIQDTYRSQIADVEVFLNYQKREVRKVDLAGEVAIPAMPVNGKIRLFDVLAQARVSPNSNLFMSYLVRDNHYLPVDMDRLLKQGDMSQNVVMRGGDKIYIAQAGASSLMVLGEVAREGIISLPNGSMPLRHVIAQAGGLLPSGDRSFIQIIRGNVTRPRIYTLNWEHVVKLPTDALLVMPGDILYVAATPVSEWNRFVNQLLPTITAYELFNKHVKGVILP